MSGKCRPSLRPKTLYNVDRSSLSTTDKECIRAVFELADHQKAEIEKNEKIIKAANDLIETQKAEIEAQKRDFCTMRNCAEYWNGKYETAKAEAIKEFAKELINRFSKNNLTQGFYVNISEIDLINLVKEMVGDE